MEDVTHFDKTVAGRIVKFGKQVKSDVLLKIKEFKQKQNEKMFD